ncbi:hypothetical protein [Bradyrhizobium rifense]|uniref:hypothetical protein n=1 Tax=Bradyrhizobium rifense TaxID=515499 RepID=UPI001652B92A|nr:hypothetical protein [Bradyrhizobium rifense]
MRLVELTLDEFYATLSSEPKAASDAGFLLKLPAAEDRNAGRGQQRTIAPFVR